MANEIESERRSRLNLAGRPRVVVAIVAVLVAAGLSIGWYAPGLVGNLDAENFEQLIQSWGAWGVAGSMALMVLHSFIPFPAEFIAVANGMVYGVAWGTVITWVGAMAGAYLAFGLARWLGRPFVQRIVALKDWHRIDDWAAENGGEAIFCGRFIPVISFNLLNYAAGLMRLPWWTEVAPDNRTGC